MPWYVCLPSARMALVDTFGYKFEYIYRDRKTSDVI